MTSIAILYKKSANASTTQEHISSFGLYSQNQIHYIDVDNHNINLEQLNSFDVIVIHYTANPLVQTFLPSHIRFMLRMTTSKKILFLQDEYRQVNNIIELINLMKIDVLYSCIPQKSFDAVYPKEKLPNLTIKHTLTGYVPQSLKDIKTWPSYHERTFDTVYRARKLPFWLGSMCHEKWKIAEEFDKVSKPYDLITNISPLEKDRIYGEKWTQLLLSSKSALGVESNGNVVDFTGEIEIKSEAYQEKNPEASYEEVEKKYFDGLNGKIKMNIISPRIFEYAACKTLMILYEGEYSGIIKPWQHYLPLKKDHSNIDEIICIIKDELRWKKITESAYEDIALNPKYSYQQFIESFDLFITQDLLKSKKDPSQRQFNMNKPKVNMPQIQK